MTGELTKVGKQGTIALPEQWRRRFGVEDGSVVIAEEREEGILIRPVTTLPVEVYTPERIAEFLLCNAVDARDYQEAVAEVRRMGLDPETIPHRKPPRA